MVEKPGMFEQCNFLTEIKKFQLLLVIKILATINISRQFQCNVSRDTTPLRKAGPTRPEYLVLFIIIFNQAVPPPTDFQCGKQYILYSYFLMEDPKLVY